MSAVGTSADLSAERRDGGTSAGTAADVLPRGAIVAPGYQVLGLLHRGSDFTTYDAWSESRFARCVVKTVTPGPHARENAGRLAREGALLVGGDHPHLVRGYETGLRPDAGTGAGSGPAEPEPFVAMQTLAGTTLEHLVAELDQPPDPGDVAMLGVHLCSALRYLHGRGVLHLDLKPGNVVVESGRAVLFDLSLAQPPGRVPAGLGTAGYLSPEQARGDEVGPAADVWGLGVTLFELATLTPALAGPGPDGPGPDGQPGRAVPGIRTLRVLPVRLAELVDGALAPGPAGRPTLAELDHALNDLLGTDRPPRDPAHS